MGRKALILKKVLLICCVFIVLGISVLWVERENFLLILGRYLQVQTVVESADVIVLLRGGRNYDRLATVIDLYRKGYSDKIFLSSSLEDNAPARLERHGLNVHSEQSRLFTILRQGNIPHDNIILGKRVPGGGTVGELQRIRATMNENEFGSAIIVTDWWHTKRTSLIVKRVLTVCGCSAKVYAAESKYNPTNWWNYRYIAMNVLTEYPKLLLLNLFSSNLSFRDDPQGL